MAIIIPSRNIYDKNHNKIRDNVIDNVEIDGSEVVPDNHYDEVVATLSKVITEDMVFTEENSESNRVNADKYEYSSGSGMSGYRQGVVAYMHIQAIYAIIDIEIDRKSSVSSIINKIKTSQSKDENGYYIPDIKYTSSGDTYTQDISAIYSYSGFSSFNDGKLSNFNRDDSSLVVSSGNLSLVKIPYTYSRGTSTAGLEATIKSDITDKTDIVGIDVTETEYAYSMKLTCLVGTKIDEMSADSGSISIYEAFPTNLTLMGKSTYQYPKQVDITFYGNTIGIDLVDKTVKIGSGKHPFSIGGNNELLQTSNYIDTVQCKAIDTDYNNTLTKYSNGKETATILCSISDYYDESKNKVIAIDNSTNKMCFRMYDIVEPYVFGANGQDKPLSKNKDGSPKQFQVLGVKPIYDGAVWQELTLQEV
jgi:hypothetical protein